MTQYSICGGQSIENNSNRFAPRAVLSNNDTLICLSKKEAYMAAVKLKNESLYKKIIADQDTVIITQKEIIQLKDSINIENEKYIYELENAYEMLIDDNIKLEKQNKRTKNRFILSNIGYAIGIVLILIVK